MSSVTSFSGDYAFLSNFYSCEIEYEGIVYPTSEHAFQAAKTLSQAERRYIASLSTPGAAKRAGRHVMLREGWDDMRVDVMEEILRIKFHDPALRKYLLATKKAMLVEGNRWHDNFWGVCICNSCSRYHLRGGENHLGRLLMKIRRELTAPE